MKAKPGWRDTGPVDRTYHPQRACHETYLAANLVRSPRHAEVLPIQLLPCGTMGGCSACGSATNLNQLITRVTDIIYIYGTSQIVISEISLAPLLRHSAPWTVHAVRKCRPNDFENGRSARALGFRPAFSVRLMWPKQLQKKCPSDTDVTKAT